MSATLSVNSCFWTLRPVFVFPTILDCNKTHFRLSSSTRPRRPGYPGWTTYCSEVFHQTLHTRQRRATYASWDVKATAWNSFVLGLQPRAPLSVVSGMLRAISSRLPAMAIPLTARADPLSPLQTADTCPFILLLSSLTCTGSIKCKISWFKQRWSTRKTGLSILVVLVRNWRELSPESRFAPQMTLTFYARGRVTFCVPKIVVKLTYPTRGSTVVDKPIY